MNRVLLLTTPNTYRAQAFLAAAERLGVEVLIATDMQAEQAVAAIVAVAAERPLNAIIAVDDNGSLLAARASAALGLAHNAPDAAEAARDKFMMRMLLARAGVPSPPFQRCS